MNLGLKSLLGLAFAFTLSIPTRAAPIAADCAANFSTCNIPENVLLKLPFLAIAGDTVLLESDLTTVSDVFRIFNDFVDTGGGTGLGTLAFLYSADDGTPLPDPAIYSSNVVSIQEDASGVTVFNPHGTRFSLGVSAASSVPEPASLALAGLGMIGLACFARKRRTHLQVS